MSSETRHLRDWIIALFSALEEAEPKSASDLREIAGVSKARIVLDREGANVSFKGDELVVTRLRNTDTPQQPSGMTSRNTVIALLKGYLEVSEAISHGKIRLRGSVDEVMAICAIIEVLVAASARIPALQALSQEFLGETSGATARLDRSARHLKSRANRLKETALLSREGLLTRSAQTD